MPPKEGNAFAQIKAKEQQHRQSGDSNRGKYSTSLSIEPSVNQARRLTQVQDSASKPANTRKTSGLDYDAELALPMPKPRHDRPEGIPSPTSKINMFTRPNVTKKRSTTEPSLPTETSLKAEASEKKKSKVATLRSKFSLKDLGKEFRRERDIPPLSSMPKLGGRSSNEAKRPSSDGGTRRLPNQDFNEAKLYAPKARKDDIHPYSAPAYTSTFSQSATMDKEHHDNTVSASSVTTPTKNTHDKKPERESKHSIVDGTKSEQIADPDIETLLPERSSPMARTGECKNTGQPEVVKVGSRVPSLKAENIEFTVSPSPRTPPPAPASPLDTAKYSPSIYDTPKTVASKVAPFLPEKKERPKISHPLIVSSSSYKGKVRADQVDDQLFMAPRAPPLPPALPHKARAREEQKLNHDHIPMDDSHFYGVTSHGGYAPPPPHPGYQNTVTLEQQLAAHVDSLHYHVNTAVQKLGKTIENSNNWTADQILRQVETITDVARSINFRTVTQAEVVKDMPSLIAEVVHHETRQLEDRMKIFVQQEMTKLKGEIGELISSNVKAAIGQAQDLKAPRPDTSHQGAQGWAKQARDGNKQGQYQNRRKSRQLPMKREDPTFTKADQKRPETDASHESNPVPRPQADTLPVEQTPTDNVPTPTAAFRTPNPLNKDATPVPTKRTVTKNPGDELSGSPESKTAKLNISEPLPIVEGSQVVEANRSMALQRESETRSPSAVSSEDLKTPKKKGMFSSFRRMNGDNHSGPRFLRTPRRTKESHSAMEKSQSPRLAVSSPTNPFASAKSVPSTASAPYAVAASQIHRESSPSLVHPALRNPHQRQIMLDRERHFAQVERHTQSHTHPLRASHSHHNFDTKAFRSSSPHLPLPPSFIPYDPCAARYAAGISMPVSTSSSSFQDARAYQGNMHYSHSASTPQLSSSPHLTHSQGQPQSHQQHHFGPQVPSAHSHVHSLVPYQFDGVEWNRNTDSNGPILNEAGYPINNFF